MKYIVLFFSLLFFFYPNIDSIFSAEDHISDQDRLCKYKDGIYKVNTFSSDESFVPNGSGPSESVSQVIKRKGSLFFIFLRTRFQDGNYYNETSLNQYECKKQNFTLLTGVWFWISDQWSVTSSEIDAIDDRFIIMRAYINSSKNYMHHVYDRKLNESYIFDINSIPNFSTFLDFKPNKTGIWKVLVRYVSMYWLKTKWMSYDLFKKSIY